MKRDLVEKLLSMTASENDSEALTALRRLQGHLDQHGISMAELLTDAGKVAELRARITTLEQEVYALRANTGNGGNAAATPVTNFISVIVNKDHTVTLQAQSPRAAALDVLLPESAQAQANTIVEALNGLMSQDSGVIKIKLEGAGDTVTVMARPEKGDPVTLWDGPRGEAATLAAALRRLIGHIS